MSANVYLTDIRPLGVFIKLLGWIPYRGFHVSNNTFTFKVHVFSCQFWYSIFVVSVQLITAFYMLYQGLKFLPSVSQDFQFVAFVFLSMKTAPHLLPLFVLLQSREHANFCNVWSQLQSKIEQCGMSGQPLTLNLKRKVLLRIIFIVLTSFAYIAFRSWKFSQMPILHNMFLVLGLINEFMVFTWWHFSCEAMRVMSTRMLYEFTLLLEYNETGNSGPLLSEVVLGLRSPWLHLCSFVRNSGHPLALVQSYIVIYSFARLLYVTYVIVTMGDDRATQIYSSVFILSVVSLSILCQATHVLEQQVYEDLLQAIHSMKKSRISEPARETMTRFLLHLIRNSPEITFSGYMRVGRLLLSQLTTSFFTYTVIIMQFQVESKPFTFEQFEKMFNATIH